jgi:N-acyl-D-amino-acid deacylase
MRGEAGTVVESVRESLRIGREAAIPVQISHHKAAGRENWGKVRITYRLIEEASRTHDVTYDIYPYTAGSANLSQLVPPWAHEGGPRAMLDRFETRCSAQDPSEIVHGRRLHSSSVHWEDIHFAYVHSPGTPGRGRRSPSRLPPGPPRRSPGRDPRDDNAP